MLITYSIKARKDIKSLHSHISLDSVNNANNFINKLGIEIDKLVFMPYKYRKSFYYDDENYRDMIYKNYTIIYKILENEIIILIIFKARDL